jgi:Endomembrane protein 70.
MQSAKSDHCNFVRRPFNNPVEKYRYYSLPFCTDHDDHDKKGAVKHKQRLREAMAGDRRESSPYALSYGENVENRVLCKKRFGSDELNMFKDAIENSYFFEMYVEDLPMYGFLGDIENENLIQKDITGEGDGITYLYPHLEFQLGMNKGKIVSALVQTDTSKAVDISDTSIPKEIEFTYSVFWTEKDLEWKDRMKSYLNSSFAQPRSLEIHWLSIINSCVLVILLLAFLVIIFMRILKNDFTRYMDIEEDTIDEEEVS